MDNGESKRREKRTEASCEVVARFAGHAEYITVVLNDSGPLGLRFILPARLTKPGDLLEVKMHVDKIEVEFKAKVAWTLMFSPAVGNITISDVGVEFYDLTAEDKELLSKIIEKVGHSPQA